MSVQLSRMDYLLAVLAVVLVPVVAQSPTCHSAITQRIDDLNNINGSTTQTREQ